LEIEGSGAASYIKCCALISSGCGSVVNVNRVVIHIGCGTSVEVKGSYAGGCCGCRSLDIVNKVIVDIVCCATGGRESIGNVTTGTRCADVGNGIVVNVVDIPGTYIQSVAACGPGINNVADGIAIDTYGRSAVRISINSINT